MRDQSTTLWALERLGKEVTCLVRLAPYGIEVDISHNGSVVLTRVFDTDTDALDWADEKRQARVAQGWREAPTPTAPARTNGSSGGAGRAH